VGNVAPAASTVRFVKPRFRRHLEFLHFPEVE
jgi:hypothetical protein